MNACSYLHHSDLDDAIAAAEQTVGSEIAKLGQTRRLLFAQVIAPETSAHLNRVHGEELKGWFVSTLARLKVPEEMKLRIIAEKLETKIHIRRVLLQMLCKQQPASVIKIFTRDIELWRTFFSNQNSANTQRWFGHFNLEGRAKLGALALEHYAFHHRDWFWDKYMVWTTPRPVTPILAAKQRHQMMHLDLFATIAAINRELPEFWESREWEQAMESGEILSVDPTFWVDRLCDGIFNERYHSRREQIWNLAKSFIQHTEWKLLCESVVASSSASELQEILPMLALISSKVYPNCANPLDRLFFLYLSKCDSRSIPSHWNDLLFLSGLLPESRGLVVKSLTGEEGETWRSAVAAGVSNKAYLTTTANISLPILLFEETLAPEQFGAVHKVDYLSFSSNWRSVLTSGPASSASDSQLLQLIQTLLLESLLVQCRLASGGLTRDSAEAFLGEEKIPFHPVEQIKAKRRKSSSKMPPKAPKLLFVGWKLDTEAEPSSAAAKKRTRPEDADTVTINVTDLPSVIATKTLEHLLAKVVI